MSAAAEVFRDLTTQFETDVDSRLAWHPSAEGDGIPKEVRCGSDGKSGLLVRPHAKTDFWRKTYYEPLLLKNDGHLLAVTVGCPPKVVAETSLTLDVQSQFDQAGLMVYADAEHWLKTGLEYSDGQIYLGCVVTNGFSDWSTQDWHSNKLALRLYVLSNDSCVVEAQAADGSWKMIRLAHLDFSVSSAVKVGLYTCAPTAEGTSTVFHSLSVKATEGYHHHA